MSISRVTLTGYWFSMFLLFACLVIFTVRSLLQYQKRQRIIQKHGCKPPPSTPQIDPIFGLDKVFQVFHSLKKGNRNTSFKEQFERYGPTFQSKIYGTTKLFTIEPKNLQSVFSTDFESWGVEPLRLFYFGPFVGKGIMTTDGAFWEHSRAIMRPTFARPQVADLSSYNVHVDRLINLIPKDGSEINLQPLFAKLALDSSTEFLFGESTNSLAPNATAGASDFLKAYNYGQAMIGRRMQLPQWNFLTRDEDFWKSCTVAHEFVEKYVEKALSSSRDEKGGRLVLARELARETQNPSDIRNQLLNTFLPAHDATSVALTNVFFNLARHPDVYARLRQEVLFIGDAEPTFERLKGLRYLQHVMNETFRLNPAIGQMNRIALRDTVLPTGGSGNSKGECPVFVRKGTVFTTSFYALHRLPHIFGVDSEIFRPERWQEIRPVAWSYLPFGGGPRVCIGQQLALTEVGYTIAKIVQRFKGIENADPVSEFVEQWKLTTESKNGAKVRLIEA